jgi:hypothetical protein
MKLIHQIKKTQLLHIPYRILVNLLTKDTIVIVEKGGE